MDAAAENDETGRSVESASDGHDTLRELGSERADVATTGTNCSSGTATVPRIASRVGGETPAMNSYIK